MNKQSAQTPQGFNMRVPGQVSNRRDDIKILEQGPNVGILYSIVDLGTHYNEHFKKSNHLIRLTFEFPLLTQLFNKDDTIERPTSVSVEYSFQMAERSNLKKFVDGAVGRILQPHEYRDGFNIGQFLGNVMIINIVNQTGKKDPSKVYNKISTVQGLTEHNKSAYAFDWEMVTRTNDLVGFLIDENGTCFTTETFAKLPNFLREKLMSSEEGVAFKNRGGIFIDKSEYVAPNTPVSGAQANAPAPVQRQAVSQEKVVTAENGRPLIWLDNNITYESYKAQNWTDELLVEHGHAKWKPADFPSPAPQAASVPKAPIVPSAPAVPAAPTAQAPESFDAEADGLAF